MSLPRNRVLNGTQAWQLVGSVHLHSVQKEMRSRRTLLIAGVFLLSVFDSPTLVGQTQIPDHPVRVTLRDGSGEQRLVGRLTAVTPDSLMLHVIESDSVAKIDRSTVIRVERQRRDISVRRTAKIGCLTVGGILGLLGSQATDPDSPGIENAFAVVGLALGCGLGAAGGAGLAVIQRRNSWEEFTL